MSTNKDFKIIVWDLETGYNLVRLHQLFNNFISHQAIQQERYIICASLKELGKPGIKSISQADYPRAFAKDPANDYHVCKALRNELATADAVIAHNGDKFDLRALNARLIYHRLPPLPPFTQIDTLKMAKQKFRFNSNRLAYLCQYLGVDHNKIKIEETVWARCLTGDIKAVAEMVRYNRGDIRALEDVYNVMAPYCNTKLNRALRAPGGFACPHCASTNMLREGTRKNLTREYQTYRCRDCGKWSSSTLSVNKAVVK